jgi:hypothetical protein
METLETEYDEESGINVIVSNYSPPATIRLRVLPNHHCRTLSLM